MEKDNSKVIAQAFREACKFLREHPPNDTCEHMELIHLVYDAKSDPDGVRWMLYFIQKAMDKMEEDND